MKVGRWLRVCLVVGLVGVGAPLVVESVSAPPAAASYDSAVLADSPISYWRLEPTASDEMGAVTPYYSGNPTRPVDGIVAGGATAVSFDAVNDYVHLGNATPLKKNLFSLEIWFKSGGSIGTYQELMRWRTYGWVLRLGNDGKLSAGFYNSSNTEFRVESSATYNDGQWHHVVGTRGASTLSLYVDGELVAETSVSGTTKYGSGGAALARAGTCECNYFKGQLDEAAFYDHALSPSQVLVHYNAAPQLHGGPVTINELAAGGGASGCNVPVTFTRHPVSLPFGEFWHRFENFSFPGRGLPLSLSHSYSSAHATVDGPLGYGWSMSLPSMSLAVDGGTGRVTILEEGGTRVAFDPSGSDYVPVLPRCVAALVHNGDGTWTFTRKSNQTVFTFDSSGKLVEVGSLIGDPGAVISISYDGSNHVDTVTDAAGRTLTFTWSGSRITEVTDSSSPARSVSFTYDGNGDLTEYTDVSGGSWAFTYDDHFLLTMRDPRQEGVGSPPVVTNEYDGSGRVISQSDRLGRETTFDYTTVTDAVIVTDPEGNAEAQYFSNGLLYAETEGYGTWSAATWRYFYDRDVALATAVLDPLGRWSYATYDGEGNVTATEDPLGRTTSATYNALGLPLTTVDRMGVTTTYTYDGDGNLESVSTPLVGSSPAVSRTVTYDHADGSHPSDVTSMTDPRGKVWTYGYDADGNRDSVTDPLDNTTIWTFDDRGLPTSMVSPRGNAGTPADYTTSHTYNAFGDVLAITDSLGGVTTNTYDANRNLVAVENPNGHETTYVYDAEDQLIEIHRPDTTVLANEYWDDGRLKTQIDGAGVETGYTYDVFGRLESVTDPLNNMTSYAYDAVGNLTAMQDSGGDCSANPKTGCTTFTYDTGDQLETVTYSDGTTPNITDVTYDNAGRRTEVDYGASSTSSWTWDSLGRLTASSDGTPIGYEYNLAGQITKIVYPGSKNLTRTYDDAGRLDTATDWNSKTTDWDYDENGNLTEVAFPTGSQTDTYTYDRADRLDTITMVAGANTLEVLDYSRDDNGQLTGEDLTTLPGADTTYGYDTLERLTDLNSTSTWAYDDADNPTLTQAGAAQVFNAANQLCSAAPTAGTCATPASGATTYTYDSRGNRTSMTPPSPASTTDYTYDQANRLTGVDTASAAYGYNADGLRASKTVSATTTTYAWDKAAALPLLLTETTGSDTTHYLYGPGDIPYAQIAPDTTTTTYLHHDQLGSVRLLTDASGSPTGAATYDAYGELAASTGTLSKLGYAGQYTDPETGYQYLRARYYDPTTAQFLTRDSAVSTTRDAYGYAASTPLNAADPSGLLCAATFASSLLGKCHKHHIVARRAADAQPARDILESFSPEIRINEKVNIARINAYAHQSIVHGTHKGLYYPWVNRQVRAAEAGGAAAVRGTLDEMGDLLEFLFPCDDGKDQGFWDELREHIKDRGNFPIPIPIRVPVAV